LIEAINSIQNDFEKVLVITHIEELKEAFPTHIEVFRTPAGSQIRIS
jgi:DNA repair protein SbcC/Rad50